jgi:serine/threonine-protein kinase
MPARARNHLVGEHIGNYVVRAKLGEGPVGAVYLCQHPLLGTKATLKTLREDLAAQEHVVEVIFREAKIVNDLHHANIVEVTDFGSLRRGRHRIVYFVMEHLDGETLADRVVRVAVATDEVLHILRQACSAVAAAHGAGILHRGL